MKANLSSKVQQEDNLSNFLRKNNSMNDSNPESKRNSQLFLNSTIKNEGKAPKSLYDDYSYDMSQGSS
jgi:hypothetical protein